MAPGGAGTLWWEVLQSASTRSLRCCRGCRCSVGPPAGRQRPRPIDAARPRLPVSRDARDRRRRVYLTSEWRGGFWDWYWYRLKALSLQIFAAFGGHPEMLVCADSVILRKAVPASKLQNHSGTHRLLHKAHSCCENEFHAVGRKSAAFGAGTVAASVFS